MGSSGPQPPRAWQGALWMERTAAAQRTDRGHARVGMWRSGAALRFSVRAGSGVPGPKCCPLAPSGTQKPA